ncbi:MAG: hypothetical protein ABIA76_00065 [Candidatus Diapherotrites archaeon]
MDSEIEKEIQKIKERNERVEKDKAWETSISRRLLIAVLTYFVITLFLIQIKNEEPFLNAIVPAIGFILSTIIIEPIKKVWIKIKCKK